MNPLQQISRQNASTSQELSEVSGQAEQPERLIGSSTSKRSRDHDHRLDACRDLGPHNGETG
jgi:hypothetical protein